MPITKIHTFRELSDGELLKRIEENIEALANLRFQKATSQVENSSKFTHLRREIARIKTILAERKKKAAQN
ncbi:MAG: 50S ribosomal protein L29 [Bacteroidetes bacterium]|nr:50S ribosomal protein L29 [Bacteroidota bacterium]